jgi:hypothetical protein
MLPNHNPPGPDATQLANAAATVRHFTAAAIATGAIPVPAASVAIVAENAAMISMIASQLGVAITVQTVAANLGLASSLNLLGRAVFVEAARSLGWATGPGGLAAISALGATTAGLQTWIVGCLAIEIGKHGGAPLSRQQSREALRNAERSYTRPASAVH